MPKPPPRWAQDLWALVEDGDGEALNQTVNTQPLMLAADIAVYRAWRAAGGRAADVLAGHSLGEYAALVAAGALAFADALPLVRFRAQAMQEAVPAGVGAMAAIMGLEDAGVEDACREAAQGQVVEAVNFNAPDQTVIAGHREAVERAGAAAKARGAKRVVMLPVSAPFHCMLMKPAAERLAGYLAKLVVDPASRAGAAQRRRMRSARRRTRSGRRSPRRPRARCAGSRSCVTSRRCGVTHVVECGPGKVLTGIDQAHRP